MDPGKGEMECQADEIMGAGVREENIPVHKHISPYTPTWSGFPLFHCTPEHDPIIY